jgi:hypothetical protein
MSSSTDGERQSLALFKVRDVDSVDHRLRAVQVIRTLDDWTYSSVFYGNFGFSLRYGQANLPLSVPKALDFILSPGGSLSAHLSAWTFVSDYISTHTMKFHDINESQIALFHHCDKKYRSQDITFKEFSGEIPGALLSMFISHVNSGPTIVPESHI